MIDRVSVVILHQFYSVLAPGRKIMRLRQYVKSSKKKIYKMLSSYSDGVTKNHDNNTFTHVIIVT
jgi:hypothetical protein